ncbi:MAG: hypothetical protein RBT80_28260 [Candidatus Vecturithrix sp.]|jgi:hypothetical protein|nr:hypothetical protein [Candidatus Vecturithrix sp.]
MAKWLHLHTMQRHAPLEEQQGALYCYRCERQHSATANAVMADTRKSLLAWFKAMVVRCLQRCRTMLGLDSYNTA